MFGSWYGNYLAEPISLKEIADMIDKWLFEKGASHQNGTAHKDTMPVKDLFDKAGLLDRLMGDEGLAIKIFSVFLKDVPQKYTDLKEAVEESDADLAARLAHYLNGASGNIGALALQNIVSQIELALRSGDFNKASSLIPKIDEQIEMLGKLDLKDIYNM
jgi:HPt (histidine-containing phosphotransfer) domain-containing protein